MVAAPAVTPAAADPAASLPGLPTLPTMPADQPATAGGLNAGAGGYGNNPFQQVGDQLSASQVSQTGAGTTAGQQVGAQSNTYTGQQQGMQGTLGNLLNQLGTTGPSANTGLSQDAYNSALQQYQAGPAFQDAALYGAGSPTIASGENQLIENLAGQSSTMAWTNSENLANEDQTYGFTPVGTTQAQTNNGQSTSTQQTNTTGEQFSNWLTQLLNFLG